MMKKRNVAMAMAAVTAVGSVAPVFAAGNVSSVEKEIFSKTEKSSLVSELSRLGRIVYNATDDKYTPATEEEKVQSAYDILIDVGGTTTCGNLADFINGGVVTVDGEYDINQFKTDIDNLEQDMKVYIIERGHTTLSDGSIASEKKEKYTSYSDLVALHDKLKAGKTILVDGVSVKVVSELVNGQVKVTLSADGKTSKSFYVKQGDNKVETSEFSFVDTNGEPATSYETIKKFADASAVDIKSNYKDEDKVLAKMGYGDSADKDNGVAAIYTIKSAETETATIADLYDGYRLTAKGNEVKNGLNGAITIDTDEDTDVSTLVAKYEDEKGNVKELKVTSKTLSKLSELKAALEGNATIKTISGNTRYTTAIEIAEQNKAKNIVLVNSSAIVDGLAATPLAKVTDSSILLTDKDTLQADTLAYIQGLVEKNQTPEIYIVGGNSAVSTSVENKLKNLVGADNVERFAGDNRHETSLSVAEYISDKCGVSNAFVVGANGEADAMSIAGYAASIDAPIIVNGFSGMSDEALELLSNVDVDIIGGSTAVTSDVEEQLKAVDYDGEVTRVEGKTRYETNANVIETYFGSNIDNVYLAKDGVAKKDQLVDALAAGPLMAKQNAPIVLATENLSEVQEQTLLDNVKYGADVTQIGGGVGLSVVKKLVNLLGL